MLEVDSEDGLDDDAVLAVELDKVLNVLAVLNDDGDDCVELDSVLDEGLDVLVDKLLLVETVEFDSVLDELELDSSAPAACAGSSG